MKILGEDLNKIFQRLQIESTDLKTVKPKSDSTKSLPLYRELTLNLRTESINGDEIGRFSVNFANDSPIDRCSTFCVRWFFFFSF